MSKIIRNFLKKTQLLKNIILRALFCYCHVLKNSTFKALYLLKLGQFLSVDFRVLVRDMEMTEGSFFIGCQSCG